jgi:alpha-tubulin suppressor-like RCC1 family protein
MYLTLNRQNVITMRMPHWILLPDVTATAVDLGEFHTCALCKDGRMFCWGNGASGQLGIGGQAAVGTLPAQMGNNLKQVDLWAGCSKMFGFNTVLYININQDTRA